MTAHDLIAWTRWAAEGTNADERSARTIRIRNHLFPAGISDELREERNKLVEYVKNIGEPPSWEGWPEPRSPSDEVVVAPIEVPPPRPLNWEGLISPHSAAYRRGSLHDGTRQEVDRMRDEAKGSPFDVGLHNLNIPRSGKR